MFKVCRIIGISKHEFFNFSSTGKVNNIIFGNFFDILKLQEFADCGILNAIQILWVLKFNVKVSGSFSRFSFFN